MLINVVSFLVFCLFVFACASRPVGSQPGMEPAPPVLEVQHWTSREVTSFLVFIHLQF